MKITIVCEDNCQHQTKCVFHRSMDRTVFKQGIDKDLCFFPYIGMGTWDEVATGALNGSIVNLHCYDKNWKG